MSASERKYDEHWKKEREAFRTQLRSTIEALLLSDVIRGASVRLPGGPALLSNQSKEAQRIALTKLGPNDITRITFQFDVRSTNGALTPGCRAANRKLSAKGQGPVSPHFALLARVAQELLTQGILRLPSLVPVLMSFVKGTTSTTPTNIPAVTFYDLLGIEATEDAAADTTIQLPKPPHQILAEAFRWARMAIENARPELGATETARSLGDLDAIARRVLHRCVDDRVARHAHDVLQRVRGLVRPLGFSETDLDKITAAFSTATNLAPLKSATFKQYRVGARARR